jgi:type I restriction enzyme S subunit
MNNLQRCRLKDIGYSQTGPFGSQLHESDYVSEGTPIVTVEHLGEITFNTQNLPLVSDKDRNRLSKYILKEGDIVFSRVGSIDKCTYVSEKEEGWLFSGRCLRVRIDKQHACPKFISFYFRQKYFKEMMLNISVGATMPSLNTELMDNIQLNLPPLSTQQKTASFLSSLDAKIELNNRMNTELEAMAKMLYDYWFVQFDFPNTKGQPYKSSGGKMVYNEELKREIPKGWELGKIADWIQSDKNGDWGKEIEEGNYSLKVSCIRGTDINALNGQGDLKPPTRYILTKNDSKILYSNDLIIEISGGSPTQSTGRMAYLTEETFNRFENPLICSNFCRAITLKSKKYLYNFAFTWNRLYDNGVFFGYEGKTSGIKNFLFDSFVNSYLEVMPAKEVVEKFYAIMQNIQKKKQFLLAENQKLSSLRDWLLPMLMNGQIGFKNTYQSKEASLSVAAEPEVVYKKSSTQAENYHKIQSTYTIIWANNLVGVQQGEMALAKDLYLIDRIFDVNTGYSYAKHNWGSFDPTFKQTINNKQYFVKKNFNKSKACYWDLKDNGTLLDKISAEMKEQIKFGIELLHNKVFYQYTYGKKPEMKELFATVLKCIEDTKSTELSVIREEMKRWKTPKQDFSDKAAKFSEQQTKEALDVILKEGWHINVMK